QFYHKKIRIVLLKVENVLNIRAPKGIDALGIISHHTNVLVNGSEFFGDYVLGEVGVLKFIHHDVFEPLLVFVEDIGMVPEQDIGIEQQVVKIHGGRFEKPLLVN